MVFHLFFGLFHGFLDLVLFEDDGAALLLFLLFAVLLLLLETLFVLALQRLHFLLLALLLLAVHRSRKSVEIPRSSYCLENGLIRWRLNYWYGFKVSISTIGKL